MSGTTSVRDRNFGVTTLLGTGSSARLTEAPQPSPEHSPPLTAIIGDVMKSGARVRLRLVRPGPHFVGSPPTGNQRGCS